ncbi:subclass B3 metallo-beta-lactamase [Rhizosphaericola mali]|uniref:Subclass B3 metallo-beta-lactamase n=1 Tax=Rhizosphaericola mali TaxID=2545455 RepID=A0A5P2G9B5_9BACT|nr:subclass B3 metallo-beta-lactamase [Rhizosphaericola mali]
MVILVFLILFDVDVAHAQKINQPVPNKEWTQAFPPFKIVGNLYYVGTSDLASYLITTDHGYILVNTGVASCFPMLKKNIASLGLDYKKIKILLTNQVHYDHVGAMAAMKIETGAQFYVDSADADVLKSGGKTDYEMNYLGESFLPVQPDKLLKNLDTIQLGNTQLIMLHHPGHTKGSCSFLMTIRANGKSYKVLLANIPTIITNKKFKEITSYPTIQNDYRYTMDTMKNLQFDLWFAAHASQFDLHKKYHKNKVYTPNVFRDQKGYQDLIESITTEYQEKIARE